MMKKVSFAAIAIGVLMVIAAFVSRKSPKSDFDGSKEIIVMRSIAHQVLRYTGDSTSPVAPVVRVSAAEFRIPFGNSFSFQSDSLVAIIDREIAGGGLPSDYIVNVLEDRTGKVIYGYAVMGAEQKSIVPCLGREQPSLPYIIDIKFQESGSGVFKALGSGGIGIVIIGLLLMGFKRNVTQPIAAAEKTEVILAEQTGIAIGKFMFFAEDQCLQYQEERIVLTAKEAKILGIFAHAPDQIIDRKRLQKEIWEDEGVIVGRSLDMFISRLRKKLEGDPDVKLVNIHGKGYKLETGGST